MIVSVRRKFSDRQIQEQCKQQRKVPWAECYPSRLCNRLRWEYLPQFRILSLNDFLLSMSVFLMMFLFIFIICILTALIICYTRCQTIALNNRYLFDDLRKLGASPAFLGKEVKSQCGSVFKVPSLVAMTAIYLIFILLLYDNDGQIVFSEGRTDPMSGNRGVAWYSDIFCIPGYGCRDQTESGNICMTRRPVPHCRQTTGRLQTN